MSTADNVTGWLGAPTAANTKNLQKPCRRSMSVHLIHSEASKQEHNLSAATAVRLCVHLRLVQRQTDALPSLTHALTHSSTYTLTDSLTHSLAHSLSVTPPLSQSLSQ
jgi:hypothetical protein